MRANTSTLTGRRNLLLFCHAMSHLITITFQMTLIITSRTYDVIGRSRRKLAKALILLHQLFYRSRNFHRFIIKFTWKNLFLSMVSLKSCSLDFLRVRVLNQFSSLIPVKQSRERFISLHWAFADELPPTSAFTEPTPRCHLRSSNHIPIQ